MGAVLGATGGLLPVEGRVMLASIFSLAAIAFAGLELLDRSIPLLQCNRETPRTWLGSRPGVWAVQNGVALGSGVVSRVGFWSWYVVPVSVIAFGDPVVGSVIFGTYGLARGLGAWAYIALAALGSWRLGLRFDEIALVALRLQPSARLVAAVHLLAIGTAVAFAVG